MDFDIRKHTILLVRSGSRAYGIHRPDSDLDVQGVLISPASKYIGLEGFEQAIVGHHHFLSTADLGVVAAASGNDLSKAEGAGSFVNILSDEDRIVVRNSKAEGTIYDVIKFIRLASQCNPNILDSLFCRDEDILISTPAGRFLRDNRHIFLSQKALHTFSGYAFSQLKRIKTHRRWLMDPIEDKPTRKQHGLPERTVISEDRMSVMKAAIKKRVDGWEMDLSGLDDARIIQITQHIENTLLELEIAADTKWTLAARSIGLDDNVIQILEDERRYEKALDDYKSYQHWKKTRNPARAEIETKYGYDCKHGGHLARLFYMCEGLLKTGNLDVWRVGIDADQLIQIRNGGWTYDELISFTDAKMETLRGLVKTTPLPHSPDLKKIDALCQQLVLEQIKQEFSLTSAG